MTDPLFDKGALTLVSRFDSRAQAVTVKLSAGSIIEAEFCYSNDGRNVQCNLLKFQSHSDNLLNLLPLLGDGLRPHLAALLGAPQLRAFREGEALHLALLPESGAIVASSAGHLASLSGSGEHLNGEGEDKYIDLLALLHFVSL